MDVGDEQIYRLRDDAPSDRVRILAIHPGKQRHRYDVEFLDGEKAGRQENVSGHRLRGPCQESASKTSAWPTGSGSALTN
jgi:hypothetical protein